MRENDDLSRRRVVSGLGWATIAAAGGLGSAAAWVTGFDVDEFLSGDKVEPQEDYKSGLNSEETEHKKIEAYNPVEGEVYRFDGSKGKINFGNRSLEFRAQYEGDHVFLEIEGADPYRIEDNETVVMGNNTYNVMVEDESVEFRPEES
jgi:hypothetical protein